MPKAMRKKKFVLTLLVFVTGVVVAFKAGASLAEWTMFGTAVLGTFGVADVTDKKLNGGSYDPQ